MRVAIVVDGLESTRQYHADGGAFLVETASALQIGIRPVSPVVYVDDAVTGLLASLSPESTQAVVFTSNSLRHPESRVLAALRAYPDAVRRYLAAGGGIVLLHQFTETVLPLWLSGSDPQMTRRGDPTRNFQLRAGDPILNHPSSVSRIDLARSGQLAEKQYWMRIAPQFLDDSGFIPVVGSGTDVVVARSPDSAPGRLVVSSLPLDWHSSRDLLTNMLVYALSGVPRWVAWGDDTTPEISSALAGRNAARAGGARPSRWLRELPVVHLYPTRSIVASMVNDDAGRASIRRGGTHLAIERVGPDATDLYVRVGTQLSELARFLGQSMAIAGDAWLGSRDPYPVRNIILARDYFSRVAAEDFQVDRPALGEVAKAWDYEDLTVTSRLAVAQVIGIDYASATRERHRLADTTREAVGNEVDVVGVALLRAAVGVLERVPQRSDVDLEWLTQLPSDRVAALTVPQAVRILDWVTTSCGNGRVRVAPSSVSTVCAVVARALAASPRGEPPSPEGAANLVMAICSLPDEVARRELVHAGPWIAVLRSELDAARRSGRDAPLPLVARLTHALAMVERISPDVVDRVGAIFARVDESDDRRSELWAGELAVRNASLIAERDELRAEIALKRSLWLIGGVAVWIGFVAGGVAIVASSFVLARRTGLEWFFVGGGVVGVAFVGFVGDWLSRRGLMPNRLGLLLRRLSGKTERA